MMYMLYEDGDITKEIFEKKTKLSLSEAKKKLGKI